MKAIDLHSVKFYSVILSVAFLFVSLNGNCQSANQDLNKKIKSEHPVVVNSQTSNQESGPAPVMEGTKPLQEKSNIAKEYIPKMKHTGNAKKDKEDYEKAVKEKKIKYQMMKKI